jgi:hypothetical protein
VSGTGGSGAGGSSMRDAAVPTYCDGHPALFCEDFDRAANVDAFLNSWTSSSATGGAFTFDSDPSVPSPPHALRIRTSAPYNVNALVIHQIPAFASRPSKVRLEFAFRIDAGDNVDLLTGAMFAGILTGARVADGIIGLELGPGPALLAGYIDPSDGSSNEAAFSGAFPKENEWIGRYALEVTYASSTSGARTGCVQAYASGVRQLEPCLKLPKALVDPPTISIALGVLSGGVGATGDIQLRFDDVVVTAQ